MQILSNPREVDTPREKVRFQRESCRVKEEEGISSSQRQRRRDAEQQRDNIKRQCSRGHSPHAEEDTKVTQWRLEGL